MNPRGLTQACHSCESRNPELIEIQGIPPQVWNDKSVKTLFSPQFCGRWNLFLQYMVLLVALLGLGGCTLMEVELSASGKEVKLLKNPEDYPQCRYLGALKTMSLISLGHSYQQTLYKAQNRAAMIRSTHIKLLSTEFDDMTVILKSEAYRCPLTKEGQIEANTLDKASIMIMD